MTRDPSIRRSFWTQAGGAVTGLLALTVAIGCTAQAEVAAGPVGPPPPAYAPPPGPPPAYAPPPGFLPTPPQLIPSPAARSSHYVTGAAFHAYLAGDWYGALRLGTQLQGIRPILGFQLKTMVFCQLRNPIQARHHFALFNSVAPGPGQNWRRAAMAQLCATAGIGL